jgi:hypothetical protein
MLLPLVVFFRMLSVADATAALPDKELRVGAAKFVATVETKNTSALLALFSKQGTSFISGTYALPKVHYSLAEIHKDFESRSGVYCVFFDTACLREVDSKERARQQANPPRILLRSVIDLLASTKQRRFVTYPESAFNNKVTLLLSSRTTETARLGEDALNFYFRWEDGEWKLRNMEFQ